MIAVGDVYLLRSRTLQHPIPRPSPRVGRALCTCRHLIPGSHVSFLDRLVNDIFLEGTPGRSRFSLASYYFQGLRSTDVTARIPFILPRLEFSYIPVHKVAGGAFRFDLNGVAIGHEF